MCHQCASKYISSAHSHCSKALIVSAGKCCPKFVVKQVKPRRKFCLPPRVNGADGAQGSRGPAGPGFIHMSTGVFFDGAGEAQADLAFVSTPPAVDQGYNMAILGNGLSDVIAESGAAAGVPAVEIPNQANLFSTPASGFLKHVAGSVSFTADAAATAKVELYLLQEGVANAGKYEAPSAANILASIEDVELTAGNLSYTWNINKVLANVPVVKGKKYALAIRITSESSVGADEVAISALTAQTSLKFE